MTNFNSQIRITADKYLCVIEERTKEHRKIKNECFRRINMLIKTELNVNKS